MFAAACAALLLVLVHPFCNFAHAGSAIHHASALNPDTGDTLPGTCCSDAEDGALMKPAEQFMPSTVGGTQGAAPVSWIRVPIFSRAKAATRITLAAPPERSYYARSARILR